jgi:hypothetical protein
MPLGTGNDLSRQFGWGGKFKETMRQPKMIQKVEGAIPASLDRWRLVVLPLERLDEEARSWVPRMLGERVGDKKEAVPKLEELFTTQSGDEGNTRSTASRDDRFFDGTFCNYFSIGFDAAWHLTSMLRGNNIPNGLHRRCTTRWCICRRLQLHFRRLACMTK